MRVIVYGVGAIGGTIAVGLHRAGHDVIGIARGEQLEAIQSRGLTLRTPEGDLTAKLTCVGHPSEIDFSADDAILLCMKTQHTLDALMALDAAGVTEQPIFCAQNGVENERLAMRLFPNVHGITVMLPADFMQPGEVIAPGTPCHGIFEIGRAAGGTDGADAALAQALTDGKIQSFTEPDVMAGKYGKLLLNLGNIVEAVCGRGADDQDIRDALRAEAQSVLKAARITWRDTGLDDPRRKEFLQWGDIPGMARAGSSTTQSLLRGTGASRRTISPERSCCWGACMGCPFR